MARRTPIAPVQVRDAETRHSTLLQAARRLANPAVDNPHHHPAVRAQVEAAQEIFKADGKSKAGFPGRLELLEDALAAAGLFDRVDRDARTIERQRTKGQQ